MKEKKADSQKRQTYVYYAGVAIFSLELLNLFAQVWNLINSKRNPGKVSPKPKVAHIPPLIFIVDTCTKMLHQKPGGWGPRLGGSIGALIAS
jgi:hypothetical protein